MVYFENKLRHFSLFPSKIIFYYNLQFLEFFPCLKCENLWSWHDSLLSDIIRKVNAKASSDQRKVFYYNISCFKGKKFLGTLTVFLKFIAYPGHKFLEKWLPSFLRDTGLKLIRGCTNGVANKFQGVLGRFEGKKIFRSLPVVFSFFAYPGSQISWKMTNFFSARYRPEICRGLHKWCCKQILRHLRLFQAKKNFFKNWKFFYFFCISGVTDFLKNDQRLFWEIPTGNLSWTAQMVLQTNFKAFWVVSSEKKKFFEGSQFFYFFAYRGSQISWKMTNYFFERYWPEICRGLH